VSRSFTVAEAAAQLGVSADTIRRRIRRGDLAISRIGQKKIAISKTDLDRLRRTKTAKTG
jgi:excisionase family DNA binding protein